MRLPTIMMVTTVICVLTSNPCVAQPDQQGYSDHPMFSRMPGFYIEHCSQEEFSQLDMKDSAGKTFSTEGTCRVPQVGLNNGVAKDPLKTYGVGPLAPVLSNKKETGRAENRRVELVEQ